MAELVGDDGAGSTKKYSRRSHCLGILILLGIAAGFVGSSFLTQQLKMPFFCSYFNNSFSAIYIIAYIGKMLVQRDQHQGDADLRSMHRETAKQALLFMPLIFAMSVTFNWSLDNTSMSNNSVICSSSGFFALLFSWVLMRSPIRLINLLGALLIMVGICLVSWFADSAHSSSSLLGDGAVLVSALLSGFYTSLISKRIPDGPDGSPVNMTLFFGLIGLFGFIAFMPAIFLLHHFQIEANLVDITGDDASKLLLNACLTIVTSLMWAKSIQMTSPFIASIGLGMTTPLSMFVDFVVLNKKFGFAYCFGTVLVILGYVITNFQHRNDAAAESLRNPGKPFVDDYETEQKGTAILNNL